jgi:RNA polymerase-interacting CarD/CdnL/TRCF family regulator
MLNLNELARSGKLDPVIGRDEVRRVLQILTRRTKITQCSWRTRRKLLLLKDWRTERGWRRS